MEQMSTGFFSTDNAALRGIVPLGRNSVPKWLTWFYVKLEAKLVAKEIEQLTM